MAEKWIQEAVSKHPGALRRSLGVPEGKTIPAGKLEAATHSKNPTTRKRAVLAQTLSRMSRGGGVRHARST